MKTTQFSRKYGPLKNVTSDKNSEGSVRAARIAAASTFLESTNEQFFTKVVKAKSRLKTIESGVLAGPIAQRR
jgi:hypothetical protein